MTLLSIAFLLHSTLVVLAAPSKCKSSVLEYSTVQGYFLQDDPATNATTFDYTATNFGLINRTYPSDSSDSTSMTQWQRFAAFVQSLNDNAPHDTSYRVLFMGRHGEGYHNAAESFYGTPAWNCYWSLLDGNATSVWADAALTPNGIAQAKVANAFWASQISDQKIPTPESYYVSPLTRCLSTAQLTFTGLQLPSNQPFIPTIKERLREGISEHTCDHRSNASHIHSAYPSYNFEPGFSEVDQLWTGVTAETSTAQDARGMALLDDIFTIDESTYISFTSHSGEMASILRVLNHRTFSLITGAVIPVLLQVKAVAPGQATTTFTSAPSWTPSPHCTTPPVTSVSDGPDGGCVCPGSATPVTTTLPPYPTSAPTSSAA